LPAMQSLLQNSAADIVGGKLMIRKDVNGKISRSDAGKKSRCKEVLNLKWDLDYCSFRDRQLKVMRWHVPGHNQNRYYILNGEHVQSDTKTQHALRFFNKEVMERLKEATPKELHMMFPVAILNGMTSLRELFDDEPQTVDTDR
jgi:hypothetical protein